MSRLSLNGIANPELYNWFISFSVKTFPDQPANSSIETEELVEKSTADAPDFEFIVPIMREVS